MKAGHVGHSNLKLDRRVVTRRRPKFKSAGLAEPPSVAAATGAAERVAPIAMFGWLLGREGGDEPSVAFQDLASDQPKSASQQVSVQPFSTAGYSFSALQDGPSAGFPGFVVQNSDALLAFVSMRDEQPVSYTHLTLPTKA